MGRRFATIEFKWPIFRDAGLGTNVAPAPSVSDSLPATGEEMSLERSAGPRASSTVDVLDRVLDKGLSIAGDIRISIAEIGLLTMRIRMIMCSIAKAQEIGLDWWKYDRHLFPITPQRQRRR